MFGIGADEAEIAIPKQAAAGAYGWNLNLGGIALMWRGGCIKMGLARIGGKGWAVVGSLNGGEPSAKLNREMALLVGSDAAYGYLADVFWYDWDVTP